jgi:hypothetical protein
MVPKSIFPCRFYRRIRMEHLPFCVFRRTGREFYYVKFKDGAGKYAPAVSTRQGTKAAAIATAYEWLKNGMPMAGGGNIALSLVEALRQIQTAAGAYKALRYCGKQAGCGFHVLS